MARVRPGPSLLILSLATAMAVVPLPAWAQGPSAPQPGTLAGVLGQGDGVPPAVPATAGGPVLPVVVPGISLAEVLAKVRAGRDLTRAEFMAYLLALETLPANRAEIARSRERTRAEALPAQGWAMLVSRLHDNHYGSTGAGANDRGVTIGWIQLFLNGSENLGFERIDLLSPRSPKFLVMDDGQRLDVAHAYAGVGALVMRDGELAGTLMGRVNTDWGDSLQEANDTGASLLTFIRILLPGGAGGLPPVEGFRQGRDQWRRREARNPPDQILGDDLGNFARDFLQDDREAALSTAFDYGFTRLRE